MRPDLGHGAVAHDQRYRVPGLRHIAAGEYPGHRGTAFDVGAHVRAQRRLFQRAAGRLRKRAGRRAAHRGEQARETQQPAVRHADVGMAFDLVDEPFLDLRGDNRPRDVRFPRFRADMPDIFAADPEWAMAGARFHAVKAEASFGYPYSDQKSRIAYDGRC